MGSARWAAWLIVVLLTGWSLFQFLPGQDESRAVDLAPPPGFAELAKVDEDQYPAWLTAYASRLPTARAAWQVLILQAVPGEPAMVIGTVEDSDGDEESTHWRVRWPAVVDALEPGKLAEPTTVSTRVAGFDYQHHLLPFDETGSRCLLVNEIRGAPSSTRWGSLILAAVLALALLASPPGH
jgi:hypothetical protein